MVITNPLSFSSLLKLADFRAVISDFDGTLVDASLTLTPALQTFVKRITGAGLHFSIATGRPFLGTIAKACQQLHLTNPQIVSGGSSLISPLTTQSVWATYIDQDIALKLSEYFSNLEVNFGIEREEAVYTPSARPPEAHGPGILVKDVRGLDGSKVLKIVVFPDESTGIVSQIDTLLAKYSGKIHSFRSKTSQGAPVFDITSAAASKHHAVLELTKLLNIPPSQVIGIGDGYNDYPLLSACGFKIAIAEAPQELRDIADAVLTRDELFS